MKPITSIILLFCFCMLALPYRLGAQDYKGSLLVEMTKFSERNDSLHVGFDIRIDSKAVPACASMTFTPELRHEKETKSLPYVQVNGKTRAALNRRWFTVASSNWLAGYESPAILVNTDKYTDERMTYTMSIPYEPWMDQATFHLRQELIGCRGEVNMYTYKLSDKVSVAERAPYEVKPAVSMMMPSDEPKVRNRQGSAFLDFQVGRSVIIPDFRRNPVELGKINNAMLEVMSDDDSEITGLFIEGYASPEGKYDTNDKLARERATALKDYIKTRYMLAEHMFTVRHVAEDWAGLRTLVETGDLPQKEQILAIIDGTEDFDAKERRLKSLSVYPRLLRDVFPELRRVEYQIDYKVRSYTTAEARSLMNTNPGNLSQAELYRVALEYGKDSPEYRRIIIETIPKYYDSDAVALNNAAALLIENGEHNTALRLLEKVHDLPAAWNNLGAVYLLRGELELAARILERASVAGVPEAVHNLKELEAKRKDEEKRLKRKGGK